MTQEQWKKNTLKIAEYIINKEFINDMLDFDSGCFLEVICRLFYGEPYWFIDRVKTQTESGQNMGPTALIQRLKEYVEIRAKDYKAQMKKEVEQ